MNDAPKDKHIRELLEDIGRNAETTRVTPRGLVNPRLMNRITVFVSILCLLIVAATFIAMTWNCIDEVFGFRLAGSVGIFLITLLAFRAINAHYD